MDEKPNTVHFGARANRSRSPESRRFARCLGWTFAGIIGFSLLVRLWKFGLAGGQDFEVYWKAARRLLGGEMPYQVHPEDLGFVFKYPPWTLPLFLPFGWAGFDLARGVWIFLQMLGIAYAVLWVRARCRAKASAFLSAALFWYIWSAHVSAGQFTLVLLVAGLAWNPENERSPAFSALLAYVFSSKIFSCVSLAGAGRRLLSARVAFWGAGVMLVSHSIVFAALKQWPSPSNWVALYRSWSEASASGGAELGAVIVRGQGNHGFTAMLLRALQVDARAFAWDAGVSIALAVLLGGVWARLSRKLSGSEIWAGWLALGVVVHPLAWHHSFVLTFPLCALALDRAWHAKGGGRLALALLGICCIGIFVPQVIGKTLVRPLELCGMKSWGVIFSACSLVWPRGALA